MAPRGFRQASRGKRQIKGSIGGGGGKGNLKRKAPGTGSTTTTTPTTTPPVKGPTIPPYVKDPTDPTLFRDRGGAFTTAGWVNVPGGRVYVLPGDTMSEAIGQGKGLISMAKTEQTRSAGGAYTQGGYTRTGQGGNLSVTRVRAGDTRSEVIGAARAAARSAANRSAAQANVRMNLAATERTGVGVAATTAGRTPAKAAPKSAPKSAPKPATTKKKATVVSKGKTTAMRAS